jgi:phage N-6-adenine-methyltransferase
LAAFSAELAALAFSKIASKIPFSQLRREAAFCGRGRGLFVHLRIGDPRMFDPPVKRERGEVVQYDPKAGAVRIDAFKAARERAKRIKDWNALDDAIDAEIAEQRDFVAWWDAKVGVRKSAGGVNQADNADRRSLVSVTKAEKETHVSQQQVSRWRNGLRDEGKYRDTLRGPSADKAWANPDDARGTYGTGENEWYTPLEYLERARAVLSTIDLDPATSLGAQANVQATQIFTPQDDGLSKDWHGRVWLNPPYSQPLVTQFVAKLLEEISAGRVTAAILLTHNYTDTAWFQQVAPIADAICFTRGRVKFLKASGEIANPTQGQAFSYFGEDVGAFAAHFADLGVIVYP